jgi:hypothetical protein
MRFRCFHSLSVLLVTSLALGLAACGTTSGLPAAYLENAEDTISLFALDGTPLSAPSGFSIVINQALRTDRTSSFDFAFNITPSGDAVLLPTGALGLGQASGIAVQSIPFESVTTAPQSGYTDTMAVHMDSGSVAVIRSRPSQCIYGAIVYYYGKVQVLQIDTVARRIDLRVLVDQNCGYRDLGPGIPSK